jgi:uncharacterized membrane protein
LSWQATSLGALAFVLVIGFWWYERSRPSSRVVALVAALAALAVASRLILTPIPNVVGTTDVALITGFALGGAPGFAVGALAAPISNIWLGQGPWTIWQMGGWGLAGLVGAGLAILVGRKVRRFQLALACAAMGFLYGALLDLSVMVTYGGEQSLDRYLALSARGLPFNVAHALGNFTIALVAGPALVRMIERYRTRFEFRWHPAGAVAAAAAALVLLVGAAAPESARAGISEARSWLEKAGSSNGGYAATPGDSPSVRMTSWAMLGLEAAGRNPLDVGGSKSPVDFLQSNVDEIDEPNELQLAILALEGAGLNSRSFGGRDLVSRLSDAQSNDGSWPGGVNPTAYGILALKAGGASGGVSSAKSWLARAQNGDGGWGFVPGQPSEADSTGAAMQALGVTGSSSAVRDGIEHLRQTQRSEGGWGLNATGPTNSQSTALALAGLTAAGVDPATVKKNGRSGLDYVAARQAGDGRYDYSSSGSQTPIWVTSQVLIGVSREALPIEAVPRSSGSGPVAPNPDVPEGSEPPPDTAPGSGPGPQGGDGGEGRDESKSDKNGGKKGGEGGDPGDDGAEPAADVLAATEESIEAEPASANDGGLSGAAVAGIVGGVVALVAVGGAIAYRRAP